MSGDDRTKLLTEGERRRLTANANYCSKRWVGGVAGHACCDELPAFLHTIAALRALVAERGGVLRDVAASRHLIECPRVGPTFEFCTEVLCQRSRTQLALTEADMLEEK